MRISFTSVAAALLRWRRDNDGRFGNGPLAYRWRDSFTFVFGCHGSRRDNEHVGQGTGLVNGRVHACPEGDLWRQSVPRSCMCRLPGPDGLWP